MNKRKISFITPTLNADKYLNEVIESVKSLDFDGYDYEIIIADGGSSDSTIDIARRHKCIVVKNEKTVAEFGKYIGFKRSTGEYIVFLDADNIIASTDWLKVLLQNFGSEDIIGVESNYLISSNFKSLNKYANLLVIVDPYARLLSSKPLIYINDNDSLIKHYPKGSSPVSGANGFIWKRDVLETASIDTDTLEETTILQLLAQKNAIKIANVPNVGIYHYYCENLIDYMRKRRKIATKFLLRRTKKITWVDNRSLLFRILAAIYLITIIGPTVEGIYNAVRSRHLSWIWHPVISFLTINTYGYFLFKSKLQGIIR